MKRLTFAVIVILAFATYAIQTVGQTSISTGGVIESKSGGFKFPDGSVQDSAPFQIGPVLHDADDQPIGYVVSIDATPNGQRYVQMVSGQGYLAGMAYRVSSSDEAGSDVVGIRASSFYESTDCTGDPILLPRPQVFDHGTINYGVVPDAAIINLDMYVSQRADGPVRFYDNGDMIKYEQEVLYAPFDIEKTNIFVRSFKTQTWCRLVDRCNEQDVAKFSHFTSWPSKPVEPPPGGWCPGEEEPSVDQIVLIKASGFSLSSLLVNDPEVTGFKSDTVQLPLRIKYTDISTVLTDF
jgi:hypothetical protein